LAARQRRYASGCAGLTSTERDRLKALERENRELQRANDILRKAAAFFAQAELDRRGK
jgi:transposase-like protein